MDGNEVTEAFEMLLAELEAVRQHLKQEADTAWDASEYDAARRAIDEAERVEDFSAKVRALRKEWASLSAKRSRPPRKGQRTSTSRLPRGRRTHERAFRRPILEALIELGGRAPIGEVLDLVGEKMRGQLRHDDLKPLPSDSRAVRWRNTAQWCRDALVREGLMRSDSPRGIWEISDARRKAVETEQWPA
jgi:restriction system protein